MTARQKAGRQNWLKRRPWSDEDRQRQRENCLRQQPWRHATGPRTAEGKQVARRNGFRVQSDPNSLRQCRRSVAVDIDGLIASMADLRKWLA